MTDAGAPATPDESVVRAPALRINVVTIFPEFFAGPLGLSIPSRARDARAVEYRVIDLRDFTHDRHRTVDDYPYGGGAGMVMKPEPFFEAVEALGSVGADRAHVGARTTLYAGRREPLRRRRRAHDPLRPLQGRRPARRRLPRHRRDLARRFRSERRRTRRARRDRRHRSPPARRDVRPRQRARRLVLRPGHLARRATRGRRSIAGTRCPRSCCPATTSGSTTGDTPKASGCRATAAIGSPPWPGRGSGVAARARLLPQEAAPRPTKRRQIES